ncbi:MAG: hypothetical protein EOO36_08630 [Cytophagaceae bacterium]|nr:MAG: hypothetical protein EOO36_08630 [Cytophagaceae bacterium]
MLLLAAGWPRALWAQENSATVKASRRKLPPAVTTDPPLAVPADTVRDKPAPPFSHRRLVVQYDSRYSFVNGHFCTINGLKLGMEWRGRVRTGAAVYFLSTGIPTRQPLPDNAAAEDDAELRFRYFALYSEYVALQNSRWSLSGNMQLGMGTVYVRYLNETGTYDRTPRDFVMMVEPSVAAQMRLFHWASLGAGAGWRQPVLVAYTIRRELSGPVFYLRANLLLGPLVRIKKHKQRLFNQDGLRVRGVDNYTRDKFYGGKRDEEEDNK